MNDYRLQNSIDVTPFVASFHDETIWEVKDNPEQIAKATDMFNYGINKLNEELKWSVIFKFGGVNTGKDMSIRCE
jgi:hypothetical protein